MIFLNTNVLDLNPGDRILIIGNLAVIDEVVYINEHEVQISYHFEDERLQTDYGIITRVYQNTRTIVKTS